MASWPSVLPPISKDPASYCNYEGFETIEPFVRQVFVVFFKASCLKTWPVNVKRNPNKPQDAAYNLGTKSVRLAFVSVAKSVFSVSSGTELSIASLTRH